MARPSVISYDDVKRAAIRLIGAGKNATIEAIHLEVGSRGSRTTVHRFRQEFLEELQEKGMNVLPAKFPEVLVPLVEEFWTQAIHRAGEAFGEERESLERAVETAQQEGQAAQQALVDAKALQEKAQALNHTQSHRIAQLERDLDLTNQHVADWKRQALAHQEALDRAQVESAERYDALEQQRKLEGEEWRREREHLQTELQAAQDRVRNESERTQKQLDYWMLKFDEMRGAFSEAVEQRKQDQKRHDAERLLAQKREDGFAIRLGKLETKLEEAESLIATLRDERDNARKLLDYEHEKAAVREAEAKSLESQLEHERTRLSECLVQLSGSSGADGEAPAPGAEPK